MPVNKEPEYQRFLTTTFWFPVSCWMGKKEVCIYNAITTVGAKTKTHSTDNMY